MFREIHVHAHEIDHLAKNFPTLLEDSNDIRASLDGKRLVVVIDGIDTSSGKRIFDALRDHAKKQAHKMLCIGRIDRTYAKKWREFHFDAPSDHVILDVLTRVSPRTHVTVFENIIRENPRGDIRACINSLEMHLRLPGIALGRDTFLDSHHAVQRIFTKNDMSFLDTFRVYEQEPYATASVVFEQYWRFFDRLSTLETIADSLSCADTVYERMMSVQEWDLQYLHCAHSVGTIRCLMDQKNNAKHGDMKWTTSWSKNNQQKINSKKLKAIRQKLQEKNLTELQVTDLGYLRRILKKDSDDFLGPVERRCLFRMGW
jgi:hypothetical protein